MATGDWPGQSLYVLLHNWGRYHGGSVFVRSATQLGPVSWRFSLCTFCYTTGAGITEVQSLYVLLHNWGRYHGGSVFVRSATQLGPVSWRFSLCTFCYTTGAGIMEVQSLYVLLHNWDRYHGGWRPSSDVSFHRTTVILPSALDKPSIMKHHVYNRRRTSSQTSPRRSPTMVTLHNTRFVECRWWNDGWTVKTVVIWRSSASMIPAPGLLNNPLTSTTVFRTLLLIRRSCEKRPRTLDACGEDEVKFFQAVPGNPTAPPAA